MKTKLLKKVRKRFEIIRIDKLGTDSPDWFYDYNLVPPFYYLIDHDDSFALHNRANADYGILYYRLLSLIKEEYPHKPSHKKQKITKIWYNENKL